MINYLQGFCGPGNFLWFLLRRVLQGLRPKVMLSELLRFPILVPNLFFFFFKPSPSLSIALLYFKFYYSLVRKCSSIGLASGIVKHKEFFLYKAHVLLPPFVQFKEKKGPLSLSLFSCGLLRVSGRHVILSNSIIWKIEKVWHTVAVMGPRCFTPLYSVLCSYGLIPHTHN